MMHPRGSRPPAAVFWMRQLVLLGIATTLLCSSADAASGSDIITRARAVTAGISDKRMRVTMHVMSPWGGALTRSLQGYEKKTEGGHKILWVFESPAEAAGTSFLALPTPGGPDHLWVYLPAQHRVRQAPDQLRRDPSQGNNFTYDDLTTIFYFDYGGEHRLNGERSCSQGTCYIIETTLEVGRFAYSRLLTWIDRDTYLLDHIEFYDGQRLQKILRVQNTANIQEIPTVTMMEMKNAEQGDRTTVEFSDVRYNTGLEDSLFTVAYLSRGR